MQLVIAGGVGAARFLEGVVQAVPAESVCAVVNTGDDMQMHGLHIAADIDIVISTLAGIIDQQQGWGIVGDTDECMNWLGRLGAPTWFKLGDRDLALHIRRTARLREGATLTQVSEEMRRALGVGVQIQPMSDDPAPTHIVTPAGELHFEEYFVRERCAPHVLAVKLHAAGPARPAPGLLTQIAAAETVLFAPSNPVVSIGPILLLPGVRTALQQTAAPVIAVSPLVGGQAIKGPAVALMQAVGMRPDALGIAEAYRDLLDGLVIDHADAGLAPAIRELGIAVTVTDTIMRGPQEKRALAEAALALAADVRNARR